MNEIFKLIAVSALVLGCSSEPITEPIEPGYTDAMLSRARELYEIHYFTDSQSTKTAVCDAVVEEFADFPLYRIRGVSRGFVDRCFAR